MRKTAVISLLLCVISFVSGALLAVDYGQEYTKAVLLAPSVPIDVILSADSKRKDVSGVSFEPDTESKGGIIRKYGFHTLNTCVRKPAGCFTYIKSLLGKSASALEAKEYAKSHSGVELVDIAERNSTGLRFGKQILSAEELVAMNLVDIKQRAQAKWDELSPNTYNVIDQVVLTVPRYFSQSERHALVDSAEIAGLKVVALVDDGLCVATDYAEHRELSEEKQYHVIYDMGAGSTRATLVSFATVNGSVSVSVEGYGYNRQLGGHSLTSAVKDILVQKFLAKNPDVDRNTFEQNARTMNKLWQAADKAKLVLSANTETRVSLEMLYHDTDFLCTVTREEFEDRISDSLKRVDEPLEQALAGFDVAKLQSVILAGGSTRVPAVQSRLAEYLNGTEKISKNVNADEAAVFGLTTQGAGLAGYRRRRDINLEDTIESNFSVKVSNGENETVEPLLDAGAKIGTQLSHEYVSLENSTNNFSLEMLENGVPYKKYDFEFKLGSKAKNSSCSRGLTYKGGVSVSGSKLVDLRAVEVQCKQESESVKSKLHGSVQYSGVKPVNKEQMRQSVQKLAVFDRQDKDRVYREELMNNLESFVYGLRSYLEDEDVVARGPAELVKHGEELTKNMLSWLDEDAYASSNQQLKKKLDQLKKHKRRLNVYVNTPDEDLAAEKFGLLSNKTSEMVNRIQDYMVTMSEDAMRMKNEYEKLEFDFDAANKKLKYRLKERTETDMKTAMDEIAEFSDAVKKFEGNDTEYSAKSRAQLVDLRQLALSGLKKLRKSMKTLQNVHDLRLGALGEQLESLKAEKEKKAEGIVTQNEEKPEEKLEEKSEEKSEEKKNKSVTEEITIGTENTTVGTETPMASSSSSSTVHQHDEL